MPVCPCHAMPCNRACMQGGQDGATERCQPPLPKNIHYTLSFLLCPELFRLCAFLKKINTPLSCQVGERLTRPFHARYNVPRPFRAYLWCVVFTYLAHYIIYNLYFFFRTIITFWNCGKLMKVCGIMRGIIHNKYSHYITGVRAADHII